MMKKIYTYGVGLWGINIFNKTYTAHPKCYVYTTLDYRGRMRNKLKIFFKIKRIQT